LIFPLLSPLAPCLVCVASSLSFAFFFFFFPWGLLLQLAMFYLNFSVLLVFSFLRGGPIPRLVDLLHAFPCPPSLRSFIPFHFRFFVLLVLPGMVDFPRYLFWFGRREPPFPPQSKEHGFGQPAPNFTFSLSFFFVPQSWAFLSMECASAEPPLFLMEVGRSRPTPPPEYTPLARGAV